MPSIYAINREPDGSGQWLNLEGFVFAWQDGPPWTYGSRARAASTAERHGGHVVELFTDAITAQSDANLVESAVRNAGRLAAVPRPRWSHVVEALAVGSARAEELCRRFGLDPDEDCPAEADPEDDHG
jgi:hypothetical protein